MEVVRLGVVLGCPSSGQVAHSDVCPSWKGYKVWLGLSGIGFTAMPPGQVDVHGRLKLSFYCPTSKWGSRCKAD